MSEKRITSRWKLEQYIEQLEQQLYARVDWNYFNRTLDTLVKKESDPVRFFPQLEQLETLLRQGFHRVHRRQVSLRDEVLVAYCKVAGLLGRQKEVSSTIEQVKTGRIRDVNRRFLLEKLDRISRETENVVKNNKRWYRALLSHHRGKKGTNKGEKKKRGFWARLFFGD